MVSIRMALALLMAAVLRTPHASAEQERDLMLEGQLEPARTYVQAQAIYRLRFYQAVDARELKIRAPAPRLADFEPIGDIRVYEAQRGGRRYRVHERSYAVFPFTSGALELGGAYASVRLTHAGDKGDGRRTIRIDAAPQTLIVLPAADAAGAWLPARSVAISETWAQAPDEARAGHAQRRTIRIEASGVRAEQIPELRIAADGMTVHAGPARLENRFEGELHVGVREQTFSMVPLRAGDIVVPALQLRWWNTGTASPAATILAARTLHVSGDAETPTASQHKPPAPGRTGAISAAAIAATLLVMLVIYGCRRRLASAWRWRRLCRKGDLREMRDELLILASEAWPQAPRTLPALAARLGDPAARRDLIEMDRALYGAAACCDVRLQVEAARRVRRAIGRQRRIEK